MKNFSTSLLLFLVGWIHQPVIYSQTQALTDTFRNIPMITCFTQA